MGRQINRLRDMSGQMEERTGDRINIKRKKQNENYTRAAKRPEVIIQII